MAYKLDSQASTYCSEVENITASQRRCSQRLRERAKTPGRDDKENQAVAIPTGSPQLFVESDEDCSELGQCMPPNRLLDKNLATMTPSNVLPLKQGPQKKARRSASSVTRAPTVKRKQSRIRSRSRPTAAGKRGRKPKTPAAQKPKDKSTIITSAAPTASTNRMANMQTVLPDSYPAHFLYQLPARISPAPSNYWTELQHTALAVPEPRPLCHTPELRLDTTLSYSEAYGQSPNPQSLTSTPSLSESLGEVFGTKDIRQILNMAETRKYRLLDMHLPAMALMLNVQLERLRSVLNLTQQLTHEQLQQMAQQIGVPNGGEKATPSTEEQPSN